MDTLSVYLDASIIVSLFASDAFTERARVFVTSSRSGLIVSNFAAAELASAMGLRCRTRAATVDDAKTALSGFDEWSKRFAVPAELLGADVRGAETILRRLDLTLRTPDAIHIAIARRLGAELATFDNRLAASAKTLGAALAPV